MRGEEKEEREQGRERAGGRIRRTQQEDATRRPAKGGQTCEVHANLRNKHQRSHPNLGGCCLFHEMRAPKCLRAYAFLSIESCCLFLKIGAFKCARAWLVKTNQT